MARQGVTSEDSKVVGVRLSRVGRTFSSTVALRGVSAEFDPGCAHLVVGANGSGKTTLLRIVATMLSPSFGQVHYEGAGRDGVRSTLGWVSHEGLVYPDLSGEENLRLAAALHGLDVRSSVDEMVERFALGSYVRRAVRTLSRGQRQRVALARALVHGPSLVLLDEPSTGLDEAGMRVLHAAVEREIDKGHVVLVVTHEPRHFDGLKARTWRLVRGRWG